MSQGGIISSIGETELTSAAVLADNAIIRGDGGVRGVQDSGVIIDDSNNVTGVASLTASSASLSTPLPISSGGTAASTATEAFDGLSPTTTKGDIIASDGSDNVRLGVGANDTILTADSTETSGVKWAAAAGGGSAFPSLNLDTTNDVYYYGFPGGTSAGGKALIHQRLIYIPVYPAVDTSVTAIAFEITAAVAGAVGRLGIYGDTSGLPATKLLDAGTFDASSTGIKELAAVITLTAGNVYYLAYVVDENGGAASGKSQNNIPITRTDNTNLNNKSLFYYQSSVDPDSALPATATPILYVTTDVHCIVYKI